MRRRAVAASWARLAAAALAVAAAAPARAYVRTTDPRTGNALSWPVPVVPFWLNRDWPDTSPSCRATAGADPTLDAVRSSFAQWEQGCADLRLLFAGELPELRTGGGGSEENLVVFRRGWCSQDPRAKVDPCITDPDVDCGGIYGCFDDGPTCIGQTSCTQWAIVALTSVLYDPATGRILDADMEVNGWDGVAGPITSPPRHGWYFTCVPDAPAPPTLQSPLCTTYGQAGCAFMDLQNTVTHEAGHFVGLAHPCSATGSPRCTDPVPPGAVPYAQRTMAPTTQPGETSKRALSADDVAGVCAIYPPAGGCGCGGGEGTGAAALLLAPLALRPRRRGRGLPRPG